MLGLGANFALHPFAHRYDLGNLFRCKAAFEDELASRDFDLAAQPGVASDYARTDQRLPLPHRRTPPMVFAKARQRRHQWTSIARRPQSQIELVGEAFAGRRLQDGNQPLHNSRRHFARTGRWVSGIVIDKNEVEVGIIGHLASAQPAHRNRTELQAYSYRMTLGDVIA